MYGLRVVTPPTAEPVTLAEVRAHARIDTTADDATLASYILAARQHIENITGRALAVTTFEMTLEDFDDDEIDLPRAPVSSIVSVTYTDVNGAAQTMPAADYTLDATSFVPRLLLGYGKSWPGVRGEPGDVRIQFVAGEVQPPAPLRHAVMLLAATWHENRETPPDNPAVDALIAPYRINWF